MIIYENKLKFTSRKLRNNSTKEEIILWNHIKRRKILDVQFYRQKPLNGYIVDFYAPKVKLAIEIDGGYHYTQEQMEYDDIRNKILISTDINIKRIPNFLINNKLELVINDMKTQTLNKIKIIGGKYKGKIINFHYKENKDSHLRPTSSRARETLFNWLMFDINNATCLDLFAGSGALSFEALSRGASLITSIEYQTSIYKSLSTIKNDFKESSEKINIINANSLEYIKKINSNNHYDIIFIDPPYDLINADFISSIFSDLIKNQYVNKDTLIYIESDKNLKIELEQSNLEIIKNKKVSSVYIYLCSLK